MSEQLTFEQALTKFQAYLDLPDLAERFSSVSINFTADWTGSPQAYVLDTQTNEIAPRLFSLETGHISKSFSMPSKRTKTVLTKLTTQVSTEFQNAYNELLGGDTKETAEND